MVKVKLDKLQLAKLSACKIIYTTTALFWLSVCPPVSRDSKIIIMSKRLASFSKLGEKLGDEQESTRLPDSGSEAGGGAVTWKPNAARREVHPRPITRRAPDDRPNKFEGSWNPKVR